MTAFSPAAWLLFRAAQALCLASLVLAAASARSDATSDTVLRANVPALQSTDSRKRLGAALNLGNAASGPGTNAGMAAAIPALLRVIVDPDPDVRAAAAFALGNIAGDAAIVLPALVGALRDPHPVVRRRAAAALGQFPDATTAPALVKALSDPDQGVRAESARALAQTGAPPDIVLTPLVEALKDRDHDVGRAALEALGRIGSAAQPAVGPLTALLRDPDYLHRWFAARALATIGPTARSAAPALSDALRDQSALVRAAAAGTLGIFGENTASALPVAQRLLEDESVDVRDEAVRAVGRLGPAGLPAVPALTRMLERSSGPAGRPVAATLATLGEAAIAGHRKDAVGALREAGAVGERSADPGVREAAHRIADAVANLDAYVEPGATHHAVAWARAQPRVAAAAGIYAALALLCLLLHRLWPLAILRINEVLKPLPHPHMPDWMGGIEMSLPNLLLVGFFQYGDRELDAWTRKALARSRPDPAGGRSAAGALEGEFSIDGNTAIRLEADALRPYFATTKTCLHVIGGTEAERRGVGHRIAEWAASPGPHERLTPHPMVPVELDWDAVASSAGTPADGIVAAVLEKLAWNGPPPSGELVRRLLERRRILVVLNLPGGPEIPKGPGLRPEGTAFAAAALVVTSDRDDDVKADHKVVLVLARSAAGG